MNAPTRLPTTMSQGNQSEIFHKSRNYFAVMDSGLVYRARMNNVSVNNAVVLELPSL